MNVSQSLAALLRIEARIDALKDTRAQLRKAVEDEARAQHESQGAAPTYRVAGIGTASLSGADSWAPSVTDPATWAGWVLEHFPTEVDVIYRIPGQVPADVQRRVAEVIDSVKAGLPIKREVEVRALILKKLADAAPIVAEHTSTSGTHPLISEGGEIVPGVVMRRSEPRLSIRFDAVTRRQMTAREVHAAAVLAAVDEAADDEGASIVGHGADDYARQSALGGDDGLMR